MLVGIYLQKKPMSWSSNSISQKRNNEDKHGIELRNLPRLHT